MRPTSFTWRDAERTIRFGGEALVEAAEELARRGWEGYELLSTPRALAGAPLRLAGGAAAVREVPPGPVSEIAGTLLGQVGSERLVALGGGRVIDTAKAIAAVRGGHVAAIPTTLSGAEMTAIHRLPAGERADALVRPSLVFADPAAMASMPAGALRASAMNALAHAADSLYVPGANPVAELAALRGIRLLARGVEERDGPEARAEQLALGSILAGYAIDSAGFALHHVICQSLVRILGTPHAETNAAILPRSLAALLGRAPRQMSAVARALGTRRDRLPERVEELAGAPRLGALGADRDLLPEALDAMEARSELRAVPDPPPREELRSLVESAW